MENKKREKTTQFQWKILRFIVIAYIVVFIVAGIINNYTKKEKNIMEKIGTTELYSVSIKDAMNVNIYGTLLYKDYIKEQRFEDAYNMLTSEYKEVVSYEDFLKSIECIDFDTFRVETIKMKTEGTYVLDVVYDRNGTEKTTQYLVYVNPYNPEKMTISPNKFIYSYRNLNFEKDQIEVRLQECNIFTDKIKMSIVVKNKSIFKDMEFISLGAGFGNAMNKQDSIELILKPGEEKLLEVEYDVNYYMPNNIKLKRILNKETLRTYTFYFEEGEKKQQIKNKEKSTKQYRNLNVKNKNIAYFT